MICSTCHAETVNVRGHEDCACHPAPIELVQKEIARIQRGAKLIVVHVLANARFYRATSKQLAIGEDAGSKKARKFDRGWTTRRSDAELYDTPPQGGPWDLRDSDDPNI